MLQEAIQKIVLQINETHLKFREGEIKSVQHSDKRCHLLKEGLQVLADHYNFPARIHYISTGEYTFFGNGDQSRDDSACAPFGEDLAAWLNTIHTRTGISASKGHVLPENGWTRINHFEVERLLTNIALNENLPKKSAN